MSDNTSKKKFGLPKCEHLTARNSILKLFKSGDYILNPPLKVMFSKTEEKGKIKTLFSVPKRLFKYAVDRNYHKRLLRENYRLNKFIVNEALKDKNFGLNIAFVITTEEKQNFQSIKEVMLLSLNSLGDRIK
ncbi:MAG: ribonuclease P protein component [Prevotellaceae bacterium]|jgi:ribonuclease P protein component|nr:ribonuclease P protein component [Prevotellaceae bacterium]